MDTKNFEIISGPSKDAVFDACKYAYNKNTKVALDFKVAIGYTTPPSHPATGCIPMSITDTKITGIRHEDGSGDSFILCGYCHADLNGGTAYKLYKFEACYNTKKRKGNISFIR